MNDVYRSVSMCMASCFLVMGLGVGSARAVEGTNATGPIGGTDVRAALLPPPGLYGGVIGLVFPLGDLPTPSTTLPGSGLGGAGAAAFLLVYDAKFLGGSLASSLFAGDESICFGIRGAGPKSCSSGAMDIYSDLLLWNFFIPDKNPANKQGGVIPIPYGLAIQFGFGVNFPTGAYDSRSFINIGSNIFDLSPNISATYTVSSIFGPSLGQATEFSARASFNYYTTNPATHYLSSPVAALDFAITQRWDNWQFGLAGTTWGQFADDKINGVMAPPDGRRAMALGLGPVISYDFIVAERPWNFTFKALTDVETKYVPTATVMMVRLLTKFF